MPVLHSMAMWDICTQHMQNILDQDSLSHTMLEHIRNLFRQMYKYAIQYELVAKNYSQCTRITKENGDTRDVPFTRRFLLLRKNTVVYLLRRMTTVTRRPFSPFSTRSSPPISFRKKSEI